MQQQKQRQRHPHFTSNWKVQPDIRREFSIGIKFLECNYWLDVLLARQPYKGSADDDDDDDDVGKII